MARHRDTTRSRGISRGPVVTVAAVLVLVLLVLGWFQVRAQVDEQTSAAAARCVDGTSTLTVAADPDAAPALTDLAQRFTDTAPVVRDQCVVVSVRPVGQDEVLAGLQGSWDAATLGPEPAVWVAQESSTAGLLPAEGLVAAEGDRASLMTSPVLLALPSAAAAAVTDAGLSWAQLPGLQSAPDGWAQLGAPQWGELSLGLPPGAAVTAAATRAVAADVSGTTPTADLAAQPEVAAALSALGAGPQPQPGSTSAALDTLAGTADPATAPYQLVPATEQQVFAHGGELSGVQPGGPVPVLDFPYLAITAPWVDETQSRAASAWQEFLGAPEQQQTLADAGFRAGDVPLPDGGQALAFAPLTDPMVPADPTTVDALTTALTAPAQSGPRSTVLLDVSSSMGTALGDTTRLGATTAGLAARVAALPDQNQLGLWVFSGQPGAAPPYRVLVPTAPLSDGGAQRAALGSALDGATPETTTSLNAATIAAYTAAVEAAEPAAPDSLLVIADGPDDDGTTTAADVLAAIASLGGVDNGVRVDVIALGEADVAALTEVAAATGGTLRAVGDARDPALGAALDELL